MVTVIVMVAGDGGAGAGAGVGVAGVGVDAGDGDGNSPSLLLLKKWPLPLPLPLPLPPPSTMTVVAGCPRSVGPRGLSAGTGAHGGCSVIFVLYIYPTQHVLWTSFAPLILLTKEQNGGGGRLTSPQATLRMAHTSHASRLTAAAYRRSRTSYGVLVPWPAVAVVEVAVVAEIVDAMFIYI